MNNNPLHSDMDNSTNSDSRASTLRPNSPTNTELTLNDSNDQTPNPPPTPSNIAIDTSSVGNLIRVLNFSNLDAIAHRHPEIFSTNHWPHRHQVIKRLQKELSSAAEPEAFKHYNLHAIAGSLQFLLGSIEGTPGSPYSGGIFHILIIIQDYPFKAPKFQFLTPIYHSNVNAHGEICLDILADWFSSCQTLVNLLRSLSSILDSPPLLDPMVPDIAELYVRDRGMWERNAREFTEGFAMDVDPSEEVIDKCMKLCDAEIATKVPDLGR